MIDVFDILFFIAFLCSVCCVWVAYRIYTEIEYSGILWLIGAFVMLVLNRAVTCLKGFGLLILDSDLNSAIGIVTIALLLIGMVALLQAILKYKRTNGNGK